ncbi:MAG: hypothetical protein KDI36_14610 [Pseudomonadales bacterium]|nr:hypothetical protein [Pseudomonadales bacterium]
MTTHSEMPAADRPFKTIFPGALQRPHFLLRIIYLPRTLAYVLAAAVTLAADPLPFSMTLTVSVLAFVLLFPHLLFLACWRWANHAEGARWSMLADSLPVTLLMLVNNFALFPVTSFVSALLMSSLIIAEIRLTLINLMILLAFSSLASPSFTELLADPLQAQVSSVSVLLYSALVATLGFRTSASLGQEGKVYANQHDETRRLVDHLKRYVSPQTWTTDAPPNRSSIALPIATRSLTVNGLAVSFSSRSGARLQ